MDMLTPSPEAMFASLSSGGVCNHPSAGSPSEMGKMGGLWMEKEQWRKMNMVFERELCLNPTSIIHRSLFGAKEATFFLKMVSRGSRLWDWGCGQEFYLGGLPEAPPGRAVGRRTGQKEKWSHKTGTPEGPSWPHGALWTGMVFWKCPKSRQGFQTFIFMQQEVTGWGLTPGRE